MASFIIDLLYSFPRNWNVAICIQMQGRSKKDELGKTEHVQQQREREGRTQDSEEVAHIELKKM